jgi:hypothetical protein
VVTLSFRELRPSVFIAPACFRIIFFTEHAATPSAASFSITVILL